MKLYDWLKVAPYQVDDQSAADDDDELSAAKGLRVLTVAYTTERFVYIHTYAALCFTSNVTSCVHAITSQQDAIFIKMAKCNS